MAEMPKSILFAGPNGVGKSRVIRTILGMSANNPTQFVHVAGSALLMKWCGVDSYEGLARLSDEYKAEVWCAGMVEMLAELATSNGPVLLIDAHMLYFDKGTIRDCTHSWMRTLGAIVVLRTSAMIMHARIMADEIGGSRTRTMFTPGIGESARLDELSRFLGASETHSRSFADQHGIPCAVVDNTHPNPAHAARRVLDFHAGLGRLASIPLAIAAGTV